MGTDLAQVVPIGKKHVHALPGRILEWKKKISTERMFTVVQVVQGTVNKS